MSIIVGNVEHHPEKVGYPPPQKKNKQNKTKQLGKVTPSEDLSPAQTRVKKRETRNKTV